MHAYQSFKSRYSLSCFVMLHQEHDNGGWGRLLHTLSVLDTVTLKVRQACHKGQVWLRFAIMGLRHREGPTYLPVTWQLCQAQAGAILIDSTLEVPLKQGLPAHLHSVGRGGLQVLLRHNQGEREMLFGISRIRQLHTHTNCCFIFGKTSRYALQARESHTFTLCSTSF